MSQNAKSFNIAFGGGLRHAQAILIGAYYLTKDGWKLENPDWLTRKSICPGIPDIYASKMEKGVKRYAVIEMESKESAKADAKKYIQFESSTVNHTVYIIHLDQVKDFDSMSEFAKYIKERLP
jgi:hypothetical protein